MSDLITEDEVNLLKASPRHLSWKDVSPITGVVEPPVEPTKLKSGYLVSYTIDSIFEDGLKLEHIMVGADGFDPDPVDTDEIAQMILGKCARTPPDWSPQGNYTHYVKLNGMADERLKQCYEEGTERGLTMVGVKK